MKPSSMQLHVSPPQNALSCTAYSLHFSRLSHSAASSSFCWMYRVPYWSLEKGKAGHASVASCLWLSCTYSFLHDFASICRNAPFYQIAISSRFSPSEQSPGSYQHPLPWQILQPGSPGQCKLHDFTANKPAKCQRYPNNAVLWPSWISLSGCLKHLFQRHFSDLPSHLPWRS